MAIIVGIHSGVKLEKSPAINEKGTLEIYVKKGSEANPLDAFTSTSDSGAEGVQAQTFMEFNPLAVNRFNNDLTPEQIIDDIQNFKAKLAHIVLLYKTEDKTKWDAAKGTGINGENMKTKVRDQAVLDIVYNNICTDFIKNLEGVNLDKEFHLKTTRQSANKHFPMLPNSKFGYKGQNAFVQDGALECTLTYTKYEIEKGKNDPTPVQSTNTLSPEQQQEQVNGVNSVFGA